jgi:ribosomal protein L13E
MTGLIDKQALINAGPVDVAGRRGDVKNARGYSAIELERAGLTVEQAIVHGLPVDVARKTGIGANVVRLRGLSLDA